MKTKVFAIGLLLSSSQCYAQDSWLDKIKSMLGMTDAEQVEAAQQPALTSSNMIAMLSDNLGITEGQAEGGLAAIVNYVKQTASSDEFQNLSQSIPGLESVLSAVPSIPTSVQQTGLGSLLDKASEYSDSVKAINELKKQFEALGLEPDAIQQFVNQILNYLDTPQGQQAKKLFNDSLMKLSL